MFNAVTVPYKTFDPSSITARSCKKNGNKGSIVPLKKASGDSLPLLQLGTPGKDSTYVAFPFGANAYDEAAAAMSGKLDLQVTVSDEAMRDWFLRLDEVIVELAIANKADWFSSNKDGSLKTDEQVRLMYTGVTTVHELYPARVKTKIIYQSSKPTTPPVSVFTISGDGKRVTKSDHTALGKGSRGFAVVELAYVWINAMQSQFSLALQTVRACVQEQLVDDENLGFVWPEEPAVLRREGDSPDYVEPRDSKRRKLDPAESIGEPGASVPVESMLFASDADGSMAASSITF